MAVSLLSDRSCYCHTISTAIQVNVTCFLEEVVGDLRFITFKTR
jgi:hypothetical protein